MRYRIRQQPLVGTKIYELDVKGQYPSIVINNNFSFDTLNCTCCKENENGRVKQETIDTINEELQENDIPRKVDRYWVCQQRNGTFPKVLEQTPSDRNKYLVLLKEEKEKPNCDSKSIEEYQTHQLGAKLFVNAGFGMFGNEYFEFANYQVAECITAEGRRIHKQMESLAQNEPYNFRIVFGFTDSTFFNADTDIKVQDFIQRCKHEYISTIIGAKNTIRCSYCESRYTSCEHRELSNQQGSFNENLQCFCLKLPSFRIPSTAAYL